MCLTALATARGQRARFHHNRMLIKGIGDDDNQKDDQCYGHIDDNLPDGMTILIMTVYHT